MGPWRLAVFLFLSIIAGCASPQRLRSFEIRNPIPFETVTAVRFLPDGESLRISRRNGEACVLGRLALGTRSVSEERQISFCPDRIDIARDGSWLATGSEGSVVFDSEGTVLRDLGNARVLAIAAKDNQIVDEQGKIVWRRGGESTVIGSNLHSPRFLARTDGFVAIQSSATGQSLIRATPGELRPLTDEFRRIDSFDLSPDDRELVISADRGDGFDVGLISAEGGEIQWVFPDPLPERGVTWAPRGSKVSYVVETPAGALLRTVHVPTSFQLTADFPLSAISAIAWEPKAEKFAVVSSALTRGPRIELLRYNGEERQTLWSVPGDLRAEFDRAGNAVLIQPEVLHYGKRYPLVVWVTEHSPFHWNPARAALHRSGKVATAIAAADDADSLRSALTTRDWVDKDRVFVVYSEGRRGANGFAGSTIIVPDPEITDRYEVRGSRPVEVRVPQRTAPEIEAFAADFIRSQLPDE